jgi:hypothetical protein
MRGRGWHPYNDDVVIISETKRHKNDKNTIKKSIIIQNHFRATTKKTELNYNLTLYAINTVG